MYDFEAEFKKFQKLAESNFSRNVQRETVCRHWLKGTCMKGFNCDFLHIFDDDRMPYCRVKKKLDVCSEYFIGTCYLKHYKDVNNEKNNVLQHSFSKKSKNNIDHRDVCLRYIFGYCLYGPNCHLAHIKLDKKKLTDASLPDWYLNSVLQYPQKIDLLSEEERRRSNFIWQKIIDSHIDKPGKIFGKVYKSLEDILPDYSLCPNGRNTNEIIDGEVKIKCFVIKSVKLQNVLVSIQRGIWATSKSNMQKLSEAFNTCDNVLFLITVNESGAFQGFGRMASDFDQTLYPSIWGPYLNKLSPNFRIQWLKQAKLDFEELNPFTNPWNDNKSIKKSRDGQEVPFELAEIICRKMDSLESEDLLINTVFSQSPRINHETFFKLTSEDMMKEEIACGLRPPMVGQHNPVVNVYNMTSNTQQIIYPKRPTEKPFLRNPPPPPAII